MRYPCLALAILALSSAPVFAQQLQAPQAQPAPDARLDQALLRWQAAVKGLKSFEVDLTRMEMEAGFQSVDVWVGKAKFVAPDRAVLRMDKQGKPEGVFEKYICTGTFVYSVHSNQKTVYAYELPKVTQGQLADDNVLFRLFTIKPEEAKKRYGLQFQNEDANYIYILITPQTPEDKVDFSSARLVLRKDTFLPREIWYKSTNAHESKWDISKIQLNVNVDVREFNAPDVPTGWKLERNVPAGVQPRVVREKQP
jgi:TIGR03009 family protein